MKGHAAAPDDRPARPMIAADAPAPSLPARVLTSLKRRTAPLRRKVRYAGTGRCCVACGKSFRAFMPFGAEGAPKRPDARCPGCLSLERHRLTLLFLRAKTDLFDGNRPKRLLHVAPEAVMRPLFAEAAGDGYLTADLLEPDVMEKMDICDIRHPDGSFEIIYCSHVLEHVPDDRKAMREFYRTLEPGGWAVLNVPVTADVTVEDPNETDPAERLRRFGQVDHLRRYGPDYADRLKEAGFRVTIVRPADLLDSPEEVDPPRPRPPDGRR